MTLNQDTLEKLQKRMRKRSTPTGPNGKDVLEQVDLTEFLRDLLTLTMRAFSRMGYDPLDYDGVSNSRIKSPVNRELKPDSPAYARNPFESGHTRPPTVLRVLDDAEAELARAKKKFPLWPVDMFHALTVVAEEGGEISKAILQYHYEEMKGVQMSDIREEAIQTIAMLVRFVVALDNDHYHTMLEQKKD